MELRYTAAGLSALRKQVLGYLDVPSEVPEYAAGANGAYRQNREAKGRGDGRRPRPWNFSATAEITEHARENRQRQLRVQQRNPTNVTFF